jgi:prepilin-type N-terminal cleavage/methylation domain-containing protein
MYLLPQKTKQRHFGEAGFTLLEIIAVLVILSIIAVVAVPRYFDLQRQARAKTMKTALAEAISRVNGHFAEALLDGSLPWQIDLTASTLGSDMGEFTLFTSGPGDVYLADEPDEDAEPLSFRIWVEADQGSAETNPLWGMSAGTTMRRPGM